jgi:hypothetical protein
MSLGGICREKVPVYKLSTLHKGTRKRRGTEPDCMPVETHQHTYNARHKPDQELFWYGLISRGVAQKQGFPSLPEGTACFLTKLVRFSDRLLRECRISEPCPDLSEAIFDGAHIVVLRNDVDSPRN